MKKFVATEYLLKVLHWDNWGEHHKLLVKAIREVLLELYYLRDAVKRYEKEQNNVRKEK